MPRKKKYKKVAVNKIEYKKNKVKVTKAYVKPTIKKKRETTKVIRNSSGQNIGNYDQYIKWYQKQEAVLQKKSVTMSEPMLSEVEFHNAYVSLRNDALEEIKEGKRKSLGNLYQYMARSQAYELSYEYAKSLKEFAKETGQKISIEKIRATKKSDLHNILDFSKIKEAYNEYKAQGIKGKEIQDIIAQNFFGSD